MDIVELRLPGAYRIHGPFNESEIASLDAYSGYVELDPAGSSASSNALEVAAGPGTHAALYFTNSDSILTAEVTYSDVSVGVPQDATGHLVIQGPDLWFNADDVSLGNGEMKITGGSIANVTSRIHSAPIANQTSSLTVAGAGTSLVVGESMGISHAAIAVSDQASVVAGEFGFDGQFVIESGAHLTTLTSQFRNAAIAGNMVAIGLNTRWEAMGQVQVGFSAGGSLSIEQGAAVSTSTISSIPRTAIVGLDLGDLGLVTVKDVGSSWTLNQALVVGNGGTGTLQIQQAGQVNSGSGIVARLPDSTGSVGVSGVGSEWNIATELSIGGDVAEGGAGQVTVASGGLLTAGESIELWSNGTLDASTGMVHVGMDGNPLTGTVIVGTGGQVKGTGEIVGSVDLASGSLLSPGHSSGVLQVTGNITQEAGSTLEIELGGTLPGFQFDQLDIAGTYTIDGGSLIVSFTNDFVALPSDQFQIATGTAIGMFSNVGLDQRIATAGGEGSFLVTVDADGVLLSNYQPNIETPPGDFDSDGDVDGRDFLLWQRGESPIPLGSGDLAEWQANYGTSLSDVSDISSVSIPETSSILLVVVGCCLIVIRGARNCKGRSPTQTAMNRNL